MGSIVSTSRYGRHYWRNSVFIHAFIGTVIFVVTTVAVVMAWIRIKGMHFSKWSSFLENVATFLAWILCIGGMIAYYYRRFGNYPWGTTKVLNLLNLHRVFGRIYVISIQGLIIFAIIDNFGFTATWIIVSAAQFLALAIFFVVLEIRH